MKFRIEDFADVKSGKRLPQGHSLQNTKTSFPYIRLVDIHNNLVNESNMQYLNEDTYKKISRYIVNTNDICLAIVGNTIGMVFKIDEKWNNVNLTENAVRLTNFKNNALPIYIYYYLISNNGKNEILSRKVGSAQGKLPIYNIKSIEIPLPKIEVQKKIAHILSTLDDKIELNRKMNQTLESMASAIFKSWFVDFDPVHAKANCTDESELENIAKELGISKAILDLFPSQFDENELGMIPKGWEIKKLEDVSEILNGHAFKSSDYVNDGIFVLRTKNFSNDGYVENANDDVYLPDSFLESHSQFLCQPYDFHLVMVGASIGKTSMILPMNLPALRNQNMWCFRPKSKLISRLFLSHTVKSVVRLQMGSASGSAREFFTKGSFFTQKVIIPKENILSKYEKITTPLLEKIANNQNEILTLQKTRDTLLPKLLSGEIEV